MPRGIRKAAAARAPSALAALVRPWADKLVVDVCAALEPRIAELLAAARVDALAKIEAAFVVAPAPGGG